MNGTKNKIFAWVVVMALIFGFLQSVANAQLDSKIYLDNNKKNENENHK